MSEEAPEVARMRERLVLCHRFVPRALSDDEHELGAMHVWSRTVAGRFLAAGGELHAHASGTVIASFDASELGDAIEVGLDLLDEADEQSLAIGLGVGLGVLYTHGAAPENDARASWEYGAAMERAQILASRVPSGEIALDGEARMRARGLLLFAKQISPGHGLRGYLVDRTHPRRDASALAMKRLGEPVLPPVTAALLPTLTELLGREGTPPLVVLRGPPGAGAVEILEAVRRAAQGRSRLYTIGATASSAVPLGSIRGLLSQYDLVQSALPGHRSVLELVSEGALASRDALAEALGATLPDPCWLFLAPLVEIDLASLAVVAKLRALRPRTVLVARYGLDLPVPAELRDQETVELTLPALRTSDARVVAESLLGEGTPDDVVRRVAVLGGETPLGVLEAARTLIACGELMLDGDTFMFRPGAAKGSPRRAAAISLDLLIAERAEMLDDESRHCLEAISILGEPMPVAELEAVLALDGLAPRAVSRAIGRLDDDGWIERDMPLGTTSSGAGTTVRCANLFVRHLLAASLHPARRAELHRFAYEALELRRDGASGQAELGLHLMEAGREVEGAQRLLDAAEATLAAGYGRAAARLTRLARPGVTAAPLLERANAIQESGVLTEEGGLDAEEEERVSSPRIALGQAQTDARSAEIDLQETSGGALAADPIDARRPRGDSTTESMEDTDLVAEVTAAIRDRDAERIEQIARRAVLDGVEMSQIARLRALADLLRGDVSGAARGLVRARSLRPQAPVGRRALLTEAMVSLRAGAATTAVRFALRALAEARADGDGRGESVALFTMAAGYRALGREAEASKLEQHAQVAGS